jgi:GNAT superfamily N-acetyltransferase
MVSRKDRSKGRNIQVSAGQENQRDKSQFDPLSIQENPDWQDVHFLDDRLYEYNAAQTGISDGRLLAIFLRNPQNEIIAGLYGWTWGGCCEVDKLWVHADWRGKGLGTRLMTAAEEEARQRGATQMVLSTHSFQAPNFYFRLGFERIGCFEDYPAGHQNIFFRKRLK